MSDFFGWHDIPKGYGVWVSCKGQLCADVYECELITGTPTKYGFHVYCQKSREDVEWAMDEAVRNNSRRSLDVLEQCQWDYDDLLRACDNAYSYLKKLRK